MIEAGTPSVNGLASDRDGYFRKMYVWNIRRHEIIEAELIERAMKINGGERR
jgi:hypothetical protein